MAKTTKLAVGSRVTIPAGTRVTTQGEIVKRTVDTMVTVRDISFTKTGNPRISWKSNGYRATAVLKDLA